MANVADLIVETLEAAHVRRIYGLVGDSLNWPRPLTTPQRRRPTLRRESILEQQVWGGSVDITTSGQNHGDPELLPKDLQHVAYP
jgi:hypothetical protein